MKRWTAINLVVKARTSDSEAMRQLNVKRDSIVSRLMGKWKTHGDEFLAAARESKRQIAAEALRKNVERLAEVVADSDTRLQPAILNWQRELAAAGERLTPWLNAKQTELDKYLSSPAGSAAMEFAKKFEEIYANPVVKKFRDFELALQANPKLQIWAANLSKLNTDSLLLKGLLGVKPF
jgi:hypothetical protein